MENRFTKSRCFKRTKQLFWKWKDTVTYIKNTEEGINRQDQEEKQISGMEDGVQAMIYTSVYK